MKILLVSSSSGSRGGGELYLMYLGRALANRGHEVSLWASDHPRMNELAADFAPIGRVMRSRYRNTYDHPLRCLSTCFNFRTSRGIAREWRTLGSSVLHLNKQNLEDGLDLVRAARISLLPSICFIHLTQSARYLRAFGAPLRDWAARRELLRFRAPLATTSEDRRRGLDAFLNVSGRARVVPTGVPEFTLPARTETRAAIRAQLGVGESVQLVLAVGRMVPQKRPELFLQRASEILQRHRNTRFLWVGDGAFASEWDRIVADRQLAESVARLPWTADVRPYLAAADLFLHVAEFEGLPLALLEAMSAGLPCVVEQSLRRELPMLDDTNSVAIVDATSFAQLGDLAELRQRGDAGRRLVQTQYSFEQMAESFEALYAEAGAR